MRFVLASSIKMACFMDTVRILRPLSMKKADFMDMSNIYWHKSIKRGHFMDGNINQPGFSIELYSPERGCHE